VKVPVSSPARYPNFPPGRWGGFRLVLSAVTSASRFETGRGFAHRRASPLACLSTGSPLLMPRFWRGGLGCAGLSRLSLFRPTTRLLVGFASSRQRDRYTTCAARLRSAVPRWSGRLGTAPSGVKPCAPCSDSRAMQRRCFVSGESLGWCTQRYIRGPGSAPPVPLEVGLSCVGFGVRRFQGCAFKDVFADCLAGSI